MQSSILPYIKYTCVILRHEKIKTETVERLKIKECAKKESLNRNYACFHMHSCTLTQWFWMRLTRWIQWCKNRVNPTTATLSKHDSTKIRAKLLTLGPNRLLTGTMYFPSLEELVGHNNVIIKQTRSVAQRMDISGQMLRPWSKKIGVRWKNDIILCQVAEDNAGDSKAFVEVQKLSKQV